MLQITACCDLTRVRRRRCLGLPCEGHLQSGACDLFTVSSNFVIIAKAMPGADPGGTPLYGLYGCVRPQRVWLVQPFWSL